MPTARRSAISTLRKSPAARPPSCSPYQPAREAALLVTAVRITAMATVARLTLTATGTEVPGPALTAGPVTDSPLDLLSDTASSRRFMVCGVLGAERRIGIT